MVSTKPIFEDIFQKKSSFYSRIELVMWIPLSAV